MAYGSPGACVSGLASVAYCNQLAFICIRKWLILNGLHLFSSFLKIFLVLLAVHWQCLASCTTQRPNPNPHTPMKTTLTIKSTAAKFHILHRTGGVYDSFRGTLEEAIAEVARRNATDDTGTTEMVSSFSDEPEMIEELAYYMGQLD